MDIKHFISRMRKRVYVIALAMLAAGLITYVASAFRAPMYAATTTFFLEQPLAADQRPTYDSLLFNDRLAATYTELIRTPSVIDQAIAELGLTIDQKTLLDNTDIIVVHNTQILQLEVRHRSPQTAADIANAVIRIFNAQQAAKQKTQVSVRQQQVIADIGNVQLHIDQTQQLLQAARASNDAQAIQRLDEVLAQYQSNFSTLSAQIAQTQNSIDTFGLQVKVVETARAVPISVLPSKTLVAGLGAIFGALLATTLVLAFELFNTRIRDHDDALGLQNVQLLQPILPPVVHVDGASVPDAYRELWLHSAKHGGDEARCWLVAGVDAHADTSAVAALLGSTIAQSGRRVALVDANFERPTLHTLFGQSNACGLSDALQHAQSSVRSYAVPVLHPALLLLPSGPATLSTSSLLTTRSFEALVRQLQRQCDVIVFHAPALASSADAAMIGRMCHVALLVAQMGVTRKNALQRAADQLAASGVGTVQAVLAQRAGRANRLAAVKPWLRGRVGAWRGRWRLRAPSALRTYSPPQTPAKHGTISDE